MKKILLFCACFAVGAMMALVSHGVDTWSVQFSVSGTDPLVVKKLYGTGNMVSVFYYDSTATEGNYITVWKKGGDTLHIDLLSGISTPRYVFDFPMKFDSIKVVRADSNTYGTAYIWDDRRR